MKTKTTVIFYLFLFLTACSSTSNEVVPTEIGRQASEQEMLNLISTPGPLIFEKHTMANWGVPLSGLLNLEHPKAVSAGLQDKDEAIQIFAYSIKHPSKGTFLIDSGMSESFRDPQNNSDVSWLVKKFMNMASLKVLKTTEQLATELGTINGVFLTHIHFDHIMGLSDLHVEVPVYVGQDEASLSNFINAFSQGSIDRLLGKNRQLLEISYDKTKFIDLLGDGSLWAIHSPGHTPGTTAYLARTTSGPQLMVGDATHTRWGWDNGVEPGSFSNDVPQSAESLKYLVNLVAEHPAITAHPGHQH